MPLPLQDIKHDNIFYKGNLMSRPSCMVILFFVLNFSVTMSALIYYIKLFYLCKMNSLYQT